MIPSGNRCSFTGRASKDPELKNVGEKKVCNNSMAVNQRVRRDGQYVDETLWLNLEAWEFNAKTMAQIMKGEGIHAEGTLYQDTYTNRAGEEKQSLRLVCNYVCKVADTNSGKDQQETGEASASRAASSGRASDSLHFESASVDDDDVPF